MAGVSPAEGVAYVAGGAAVGWALSFGLVRVATGVARWHRARRAAGPGGHAGFTTGVDAGIVVAVCEAEGVPREHEVRTGGAHGRSLLRCASCGARRLADPGPPGPPGPPGMAVPPAGGA